MTITAGINDNLVKRFGTYFSTNKSLRITRFGLKKKGQHDRGDAKYSIVIFLHTIVETIDQVCKVRNLVPDMIIGELLSSNESYAVGSIAAIVAACEYNRQFDLYIKDGETANDHITLQVSEAYTELFLQIQEQLACDNPPFYLFKNVVRNDTKGSHMIWTCAATFIDPLNDDYAIQSLVPIIDSKTQAVVVNMLNHIVVKAAEERPGMGRIGKTGIPKVRPGGGGTDDAIWCRKGGRMRWVEVKRKECQQLDLLEIGRMGTSASKREFLIEVAIQSHNYLKNVF